MMQTRRSFFSRLGAIVAAVALAPQIAFARELEVISPVDDDYQRRFVQSFFFGEPIDFKSIGGPKIGIYDFLLERIRN